MRGLFIGICICFCLAASGRPVAQVTFHVVDDAKHSVTGFAIGLGTFLRHIPGDNFGTDENTSVWGVTDTNGWVTLSIPSITGEVTCWPYVPDRTAVDKMTIYHGNYGFRHEKIRFKEAVSGRWQPWNPTVEVEMKRIVNPIPLYTKSVKLQYPKMGESFGFDLLKADWVSPHGKGERADFIFSTQTHYDGSLVTNYTQKTRAFESSFTLRFSCEDDGIQPFYADPLKGSVLRLPRMAPESNYEKELIQHKYVRRQGRYLETRRDENWFFRVRTEKDEEGNIVSALYGKIHGAIQWGWEGGVVFSYYLNPTPNDRNLEFDGKNNLFKPDWRDTSWPKEP
ncbi:MAG: hypothetical protein ACOX5G_06480 [Kiritimatiellia bacterium]|jgi:hypothetical protein